MCETPAPALNLIKRPGRPRFRSKEVIETTAARVGDELARVVAGGLTYDDIDRLIKQAHRMSSRVPDEGCGRQDM
jgi:hypothetical protein